MCEFCHKHGEGKKWYLEAENYAEDLISDMQRRKIMHNYLNSTDYLKKKAEDLKRLDKAPSFIRRVIRWRVIRDHKKTHFGQVIPIEDVEKIFKFVNTVTRITCMCRDVTMGKEHRFCYGLVLGPSGGPWDQFLKGLDGSFLGGPDMKGIEVMDKEQALKNIHKYERLGLCHTVWTFKTPFVGGICNCDRSDCMAMRATFAHDVPIMFRAEYVAENNHDLCKGCRRCMKVCQYGAIAFSAADMKSVIDPVKCYGCGICRSMCGNDAIKLVDRQSVPQAANLWM
jgi:Pyruvate/2-oxoacid:ferredoxin oxidoreductase delta subunit